MAESLHDLLEARTGIVCAVGAGGKKSLLQHLATRHPDRVAITATVFTTYFQEHLGFDVILDEEDRLPGRVAQLGTRSNVAYACPSGQAGRRAGVAVEVVERIHREGGFAATYVKADGARMRLVKAPAEDEPVVPAGCVTVLAVASALAIGEPLTARVAHRVDRISGLLGLEEGARLSTEHLGRLLASPEGMLKSTQGRRVVPVINMVDDRRRERLAREAAEIALGLSPRFDRVVLTRLSRPEEPLVAVVRR